ncbi:MAG: hypothetical protein AB1Z65_05830 [Candidatus Sulfomarinibacteraceae bacterium]
MSDAQRREVLGRTGASPSAVDELMTSFAGDRWWPNRPIELASFPLADDPLVEAWAVYAADAGRTTALEALRDRIVQLSFPIRSGISAEDGYRAATLKGVKPDAESPLELEDPDGLSLTLHPSLAGTIPILAVRRRPDFETMVRALTARNEPVPIPRAMGACLINGLNNWDRIATLKKNWETTDPAGRQCATWGEEFRRIIPRTELYKDRLIVLSHGPYSGVEGEEIGIDPDEWDRLSFSIRLEHECVHALSLKLFGAMRHDLLEELVADWVALVKVFGGYRADLALRFLGLESFPGFRAGGRLEVYRGTPPVSDVAFEAMQRLAAGAIETLAAVSEGPSFDPGDDAALGRLTVALLTMPLEALVVDDAVALVQRRSGNLENVLSGS